jgi:hypothetical protein
LTEVPTGLQRDPEFAAGQKSVAESVEKLRAAALSHDRAAVQRAINGLKKPYSQVFVKFS